MSDLLLASELRRLAAVLRPLMHQSGITDNLSDETRFPGEGYTTVFFDELNRWLAHVLGEKGPATP